VRLEKRKLNGFRVLGSHSKAGPRRSKIGYLSVCRVGEPVLSQPVGWRRSSAPEHSEAALATAMKCTLHRRLHTASVGGCGGRCDLTVRAGCVPEQTVS
jgi:hypothetical protein